MQDQCILTRCLPPLIHWISTASEKQRKAKFFLIAETTRLPSQAVLCFGSHISQLIKRYDKTWLHLSNCRIPVRQYVLFTRSVQYIATGHKKWLFTYVIHLTLPINFEIKFSSRCRHFNTIQDEFRIHKTFYRRYNMKIV